MHMRRSTCGDGNERHSLTLPPNRLCQHRVTRGSVVCTAFTLLVASVPDEVAELTEAGAEVTEPVAAGPAGRRARVRLPDATLVELIDHRPRPGEGG